MRNFQKLSCKTTLKVNYKSFEITFAHFRNTKSFRNSQIYTDETERKNFFVLLWCISKNRFKII